MSSVSHASTPLAILGLDTGDPDSIERWAAEGYLPTIAGLMHRGSWGRVGGPELVCEYGVGLTLFSGMSRSRHGYYYFRQLRPGTYDLVTVAPPVDHAPPFWSELRSTEQRVLVVDVPDVRPLRGLAGLQLSNWATHHGFKHGPEAEPPALLDDARRAFGPRLSIRPAHDPKPREARAILEQLLERVRRKGRLCRALLDRGPFDLSVLFFSETDAASHTFWGYRPEAGRNGASEERRALKHGIRDVYAAIDRELGEIVARLPEETNVCLLSLYGCQDEYPTSTLIDSFLRSLGYHVEATAGGGGGCGRQSTDRLALARRVLPLGLRESIGRRLPGSAQERLLSERLRATTNWSRTTAFAIPSLFTSFVRVNLAGREPAGIVQPGAEYEAVLDRIAGDLRLLTDASTGAPAVRRAVRSTELFGGGPPAALPDLFVEWEPGPRLLTRVVHPRATLVQPAPAYCPDSQESLTGFVAAAGPSFRAGGDVGELDLADLAPTFLRLLERPPAPSMTGRPLGVILR